MMSSGLRLGGIAAMVCLVGPRAASADWPMARHDPARTAFANGEMVVHAPAVRWRYYLGSALDNTSYVAADVDTDTLDEVLFVAGGKLLAARANGIVLWEAPPMGLARIEGLADLNGDGTSELVASGPLDTVVVVNVASGEVLWKLPGGVIGTAAGTRIADFDGDGVADLYVAECRCCTVDSHEVGVAYSFAAGFGPTVVTELWRLTGLFADDDCNTLGDTVGDFNGDGSVELVVGGNGSLAMVNGTTGLVLSWFAPSIGSFTGGGCNGDREDVDGDGSDELFFFEDSYRQLAPLGRRWVAMFQYDASSGDLVLPWHADTPDPATDRHQFDGRSLADLDGDGSFEVVTSFLDGASMVWAIRVLDANSGILLGTAPGYSLAGVVDVTGDGVPEILGQDATSLVCLAFGGGMLRVLWALDGLVPVQVVDRGRMATRSQYRVVASQDVDADGVEELLARSSTWTPAVSQRVVALNAELAAPTEAASYSAPPGVRLDSFGFSERGLTAHETQLLAVRSDGYLVAFDHALTMTNFSDDVAAPRSGLRVGGFYSGRSGLGATPVVGPVSGSGERPVIVATTSRGSVVRLDTSAATFVVPPRVLWEKSPALYPSLVDLTGDGAVEVAYRTQFATPTPTDGVGCMDSADARERWTTVVSGAASRMVHDLPFGDVNGDAVPDFFASSLTNANVEAANVLDGRSGVRVWPADYSHPLPATTFAKALSDANGDGAVDLVGVYGTFFQISGADGSVLRENATAVSYMFPLVADVTPDPGVEYFFHGGHYPPVLLRSSDLSVVWAGTGGPYTGALATVLSCAGNPVFVGAAYESAQMFFWHGATGVVTSDVWLAGGALFHSEAEMSGVAAYVGVVGAVTGVQELRGDGSPAVLVGSTDGFLYAVDPCARSLVWAFDMGAPVGESVVADTDADGRNEIVVSVADGYLYNIADELMPATGFVWDTDPPHGYPDADRDEIETVDTLYVLWSPVAGATGYEYAVVGPGDAILTIPPFVSARMDNSAVITALPLVVGEVYTVAVRVVGPAGTSSETISDGIVVVDRTPPTLLLTAAPRPFSPNGDGVDDVVTITARMADSMALADWSTVVRTADGMGIVRTLGTRSVSGRTVIDSITWDGNDDAGARAAEGLYRALVIARDSGGNTASAAALLELVRAGGADADAGDDGGDDDGDGAGDGDASGEADVTDGRGEADGVSADADVSDRDVAPDAGAGTSWSGEGAGCTCGASGGSGAPVGLLAVVVGVLIAARRRRSTHYEGD